jgi:hypothetical protein
MGIWRIATTALVAGAAGVGVSMAAAQAGGALLYGDTFVLSGNVEDGGAGRTVVVLARPHGRQSFAEVGRVRTTAGGRWRYSARPSLRTVYRARIGRLLSAPVAVNVEPRIVLQGERGRFTARVRAARSLAGRFVFLQRRTSGSWENVRRLVLDDSSSTRFGFTHSRTGTEIRLLMPLSQVGHGYVQARSGVITLPRR